MSAVWMRLGAELRERWRAWLALALLVGTFGGAVVAAAAGAARTGSVVDRHLAERKPPDIFFVPAFGIQPVNDVLDKELLAALSFDRLRRLPSVAEAVRLILPSSVDDSEIAATDDPRLGSEIFPANMIEGRLPNRTRADEASVNVLASQQLGLHAGDSYTIDFLNKSSGIPGDDVPAEPGPTVRFRITGVTASLGDFAAIAEPSFALTPAFLERYGNEIQGVELSMLRLEHGSASYGAFRDEIEKLTGGQTVFYAESGTWDETRRSFGLQAISLWILAALLAFVTVMVLGQTISRQTYLESAEHPMLRALGLSQAQLFALGAARAAIIGLAGATGAVAIAAAASPFTPFGNARLADPGPAFSFPVAPMLLGFAGVILAVVALALFPAWRATKIAASGFAPAGEDGTERPSRIAKLAARFGRGPAAGIGFRLALEPGRGRTAVPVRTTIFATAVGLLALTAALVVASSLGHLAATPRLYGWDWDVAVGSPEDPQGFRAQEDRAALTSIPGVAAATFGPAGGNVLINGKAVEPFALQLGAQVHPPILEGRAPAAPDELLLARKTLQAVGAEIGDTVEVGFQGADLSADFRVVGVTVLPVGGEDSTLGEGVWVPIEDIERLFGQPVPMDRALVRFSPDADRAAATKAIEAVHGEGTVVGADPPTTVVDFGRVSNMPSVLAGIVALLAGGTLAHGLATAVRRRRRDLAILKALGLDRGQVRRAVGWQATATGLMTLAVGIPLGVITGRWIWILFANEAGFLAEPTIDVAVIGLTIPAALVLANLIAALPGRSAARTQPALVLRTE